MKRFLIFKNEYYYPGGGMNDLVYQTDDFEEAMDGAEEGLFDKQGEYHDMEMLDTSNGKYYRMEEGNWKFLREY